MTAARDTTGDNGQSRTARPSRFPALRAAADAAAALAFFVLATMALTSVPTAANPNIPGYTIQFTHAAQPALANAAETPPIVEIATTSSPQAADAVFRRTSSTAAWVLLSLSFSLLIAFNLAMLRHMRRAYAKPSRAGR